MSSGGSFPRARAMLDAPGPGDGAIWTSITGLAAAAVILFRVGKSLGRSHR